MGGIFGLSLIAGGPEQEPRRYADELEALRSTAGKYWRAEEIARPMPRQEQLAVRSNPRLRQAGATAAHAVVVVHPGYLMLESHAFYKDLLDVRGDSAAKATLPDYMKGTSAEAADDINRELTQTRVDRAKGNEGDYGTYLNQLGRVFTESRQDANTPLFVFTEERHLYSGVQKPASLAVPDHAIQISTVPDDPAPTKTVRYQNPDGTVETERQDLHLIYDWLSTNDITTVHMAGEYGLKPGGAFWSACAGRVAINLQQQGFTVHGIEGAVFPSQPLNLYDPQRRTDRPAEVVAMADALYVHTVPVQ